MVEPRKDLDDTLIDEATKWFALLRSDAATDDDRRAFEDWRNADPRHADVYAHTLSIWEDVGALDELKALASDPEFGRPRRFSLDQVAGFIRAFFSAPRLVKAALGAAGLAVAAIALSEPAWLLPNVHATATAQTARVTASDGSVIDLGPQSKVIVAFSGAERRIYLKRGEAFFDVDEGDNRVFVVRAGDAEIRVTGTKFNVRQGPTSVTVAVAEGAVTLRRTPGSGRIHPPASAALTLHEGQLTAAPSDDDGFAEIVDTAPSIVGAWRTGHLHYAKATLRDVIADANRYSRVPIVVGDERLLDLTLVAAFRTDQIDAMIDGLPEILPLDVVRSERGRIVLRARRAGAD